MSVVLYILIYIEDNKLPLIPEGPSIRTPIELGDVIVDGNVRLF